MDVASWLRVHLFGRSDVLDRIDDIDRLCEKGAFSEAYSIVRSVMDKYPQLYEDGDACVLMAELELCANQNVERTFRLLDKARELGFSDEIRYYRTHGQALREVGQREAAIAELEKCVAADADLLHLIVLAETLSFFDDPRAVNTWQQVLERDPKNCLAHVYIGRESIKAGKPDTALAEVRQAEDLSSSAEDIFEIGRLYHELEESTTAIEKYLKADELGYTDKPLLYACVAACHLSLGEGAPAKEYGERALRCDPEHRYAKHVWHEYETRLANGWLA